MDDKDPSKRRKIYKYFLDPTLPVKSILPPIYYVTVY